MISACIFHLCLSVDMSRYFLLVDLLSSLAIEHDFVLFDIVRGPYFCSVQVCALSLMVSDTTVLLRSSPRPAADLADLAPRVHVVVTPSGWGGTGADAAVETVEWCPPCEGGGDAQGYRRVAGHVASSRVCVRGACRWARAAAAVPLQCFYVCIFAVERRV